MRDDESNIQKRITSELNSVLNSYDHDRQCETYKMDKESKSIELKRQEKEKSLMSEMI